MDKQLVNEIIDCLPKERTLFRYFKDRYALILLKHFIGDEMDIREIKNSRMASLLQKPVMREFLANIGSGKLTNADLKDFWLNDMYSFVLTLDQWGGDNPAWDQTSRKGHNIVLQLNFSNQHDGAYVNLVKPRSPSALNYYGHPVYKRKDVRFVRETLAWARIDLDFDTNEALIEEIQSDWVREGSSLLHDAKHYSQRGYESLTWWNVEGHINDLVEYCEKVLKPYQDMWSEAMLAAAIEFIKSELGIKTIYYHTDTTGYRVKRINYDKPPKSLYQKLPKQFCFDKVGEAPEFLTQDKTFRRIYKKVENPAWFRMQL